MTRARSLVLGVLVLALAATQHFGLERLPETEKENALRNLPDVPAGDMLPTYVASLFFGAFRAVAIDVLWIQLKRAEEERRWYERREILKMISYVQPRNPEVWSHLGWHSAYNVANGFTDPEKSWSWVRFGLTWLRQGIRRLPDNPHLKFELAFTLLHKPSWRDAELDLALMKRFEADEALLRDLAPENASDAPRTMLDFARIWFERAKADIERGGAGRYKTQMGLFIYPSTLDGYIRKTYYLEAIRAWHDGRLEDAVSLTRKTEAHVRRMLDTRYPEGRLSSIYQDWELFYRALPEVFIQTHKAQRSGRREDQLAALKVFQELAGRWDWALDENFLWSRSSARAPLHVLKRAIVGEVDDGECNDGFAQAFDIPEGSLAQANLEPAGLDVDWYWLSTRPPQGTSNPIPSRPLKLRLLFQRPPASGADLKVTVFDEQKKVLRAEEVKGKSEFEVPLARFGRVSVKVEPRDPAAPLPADSRYFFQWRVAE